MDSNARIRNVDQQAQTMQEEMEHDQIFNWLSAPDTALSHYQASVKRAPATGEWFIRSASYQQWKAMYTGFTVYSVVGKRS